MTIRAFTQSEETALLDLAAAPRTTWKDLPATPGPSVHIRLARLGLSTIMATGPHRRARLTKAGRYFADLLEAKGAHHGG